MRPAAERGRPVAVEMAPEAEAPEKTGDGEDASKTAAAPSNGDKAPPLLAAAAAAAEATREIPPESGPPASASPDRSPRAEIQEMPPAIRNRRPSFEEVPPLAPSMEDCCLSPRGTKDEVEDGYTLPSLASLKDRVFVRLNDTLAIGSLEQVLARAQEPAESGHAREAELEVEVDQLKRENEALRKEVAQLKATIAVGLPHAPPGRPNGVPRPYPASGKATSPPQPASPAPAEQNNKEEGDDSSTSPAAGSALFAVRAAQRES